MKNKFFIIFIKLITFILLSNAYAKENADISVATVPFNPKKRVELVTDYQIFEGREKTLRDAILQNGLQNKILIGEKTDFSRKLHQDDYRLTHRSAASCGVKNCGVWVFWELFRQDGAPVRSDNRYYPLLLSPAEGKDRNIWRKVPDGLLHMAGYDMIAGILGKPSLIEKANAATQPVKTGAAPQAQPAGKQKTAMLAFADIRGAAKPTSDQLNRVLAYELAKTPGNLRLIPVKDRMQADYIIEGNLTGADLGGDLIGVTLTRAVIKRNGQQIGAFKVEIAEKKSVLTKRGIHAEGAANAVKTKIISIIGKDRL